MGVIAQTNRCILFEDFNNDTPDLLTLLGDGSGMQSLNDDLVEEINGNLLVRSFDEFLEKIKPCIYYYFDAGSRKMAYSVNKPALSETLIHRIPLDKENDLIKLFLRLFDSEKEKDGQNGIMNFEHFLDFLSPHMKAEEFMGIQDKLVKKFMEYKAANGEKKEELYYKMQKVSEETGLFHYDIMSLITIALKDMKQRLMPEKEEYRHFNPIAEGISSMKEEDLHIVDLPVQGRIKAENINSSEIKVLKEIVLYGYRKKSGSGNAYMEHLLLRSYGLEPVYKNETEKEQLLVQYNEYLDFYAEATEGFINAVKPLLQKILGVRRFFDQYNVRNPEMGMSLLITNVKNEMWFKPEYSKRLKSYLNTVNLKIDYTNTIWMAIIPTVTFPPDKLKNLSRERFKGNKERHIERTNSILLAAHIMDLTAAYGILNFFSFECDETTTFSYTAKMGISHFISGCKPFMNKDLSGYAIPCIPNFTIIPKECSHIHIGRKLCLNGMNKVEESNDKADGLKVWMGGIHIEAAYVAAGLTAACQCPSYLKERYGDDTQEGLPGVRYDIEASEHRFITTTVMAKEVTGYEEEVLEEIGLKNFGFIFASETYQHKKNRIVNVSVLKARSLMSIDGKFEPAYKILTEKYIERVFRYDTFDHKKEEIIRFFQNHPENRRNLWQAARKKVNAILREEDSLSYELDESNDVCILEISFGGQPAQVTIDLAAHLMEDEEGEG